MDVANVITQLRTYAPIFGGRVGGASQYEAIEMSTNTAMPAAFVIPLSDDATPNGNEVGLYQVVSESIGIVVMMDNRADQRGQAVSTIAYSDVRAAIWAALLNWAPSEDQVPRGMEYVGAHLLVQDRARTEYQFIFRQDITITAQDNGFQSIGVDLTETIVDTGLLPAFFT